MLFYMRDVKFVQTSNTRTEARHVDRAWKSDLTGFAIDLQKCQSHCQE